MILVSKQSVETPRRNLRLQLAINSGMQFVIDYIIFMFIITSFIPPLPFIVVSTLKKALFMSYPD